MYTMQLPCICTYVWLVVTEICMVSVTSRNVPKFGTEGKVFYEQGCLGCDSIDILGKFGNSFVFVQRIYKLA